MKLALILIAITAAIAGTLVTGAIIKIDDDFVPCGSSPEVLKQMHEMIRVAARAWPEGPAVDKVREYARSTESLLLSRGANVEVLRVGDVLSRVKVLTLSGGKKSGVGVPNNLCWIDTTYLRDPKADKATR